MSNLIIKLGPYWARFSRSVTGMSLLGTVQQDAGIGALARSPDGTYWQINGDYRRKLNASQVAWALSMAQRQGPAGVDAPPRRSGSPQNPMTPTVTIKRKRAFAASEG